jgi:hypothetical protein
MQCEAITQTGERCQLDASEGATWCYSHNPAFAEERRRNASRAGRAGGNGRGAGATDLGGMRKALQKLIADVSAGKTGRAEGAVVIQAYNSLLRLAELERKIKEDEELAARLAVLENTLARASRFGLVPRGGDY